MSHDTHRTFVMSLRDPVIPACCLWCFCSCRRYLICCRCRSHRNSNEGLVCLFVSMFTFKISKQRSSEALERTRLTTRTQQQRPESPGVTLTWLGCKNKVHTLYQSHSLSVSVCVSVKVCLSVCLCESQGGRPGLSVLTSLLVSVDVKLY